MEPPGRDFRSLALHLLAAQKIRRQPALFNRLQETLDRWRLLSHDPRPDLVAWQRVLDSGMEPTLAAATDRSEAGRALRRASIFVSILTDEERAAVLLSRS
ncbi:hypothetical protein [Acidovorax sp. Leaf160]|uniref:hypothetical protein n=1 Tax=Acidovorax sp. Leaf160 TaxID=1736280 RepID=UPI0006F96935|nr:hypothetical protein [Acidovorax sp. Leaf160]KQR60941.1 hypothetical protein ASF94_17250 [Acidovorax sp. Leaf160]